MAVTIDPREWAQANVVQIESDAADNPSALRELEDWCAAHGFARTTEYWLRPAILKDGRRVFRGTAFRLSPEELAAADAQDRAVEERMRRMPVTNHGDVARA
jgi:hypothetical protein